MKQYVAPNQLRLVGKGREIKRQLRELASAVARDVTIASFTSELPPIQVKLGGQPAVKVTALTSAQRPLAE